MSGEREKLRKKIQKDLVGQLKEKSIVGHHYTDLVQDYLALWDLKCDLIDEIQASGIQVPGMHGPKSNPSITDLHKTNDRMLKILDAIGLKAEATDNSKEVNKRSASDLL